MILKKKLHHIDPYSQYSTDKKRIHFKKEMK